MSLRNKKKLGFWLICSIIFIMLQGCVHKPAPEQRYPAIQVTLPEDAAPASEQTYSLIMRDIYITKTGEKKVLPHDAKRIVDWKPHIEKPKVEAAQQTDESVIIYLR